MTEANLLRRYATDRDTEAFAEIVRQYQRLVFATCRRRLHLASDVEDAVQETFLRLAQHAGELRSNLGGWLHACAVNIATDINRRRTTRLKHETAAVAAKPSEPAAECPQQMLVELREQVDAALQKLDADQRELIIQRYFVGRPQVELAAEAGVSPPTISHRLDRAIAALREHLQALGCGAAAVGGPAVVAQLLEAEAASAAVPQTLTASIMKIGLSGAPAAGAVAAGTLLSATVLKIAAATVAAIALAAGGIWLALVPPSPSATPGAPTTQPVAIRTGAATPEQPTQALQWQPAQPTDQPAVLAGRVLDRDGKPVANATVRLTGPTGASATTDAQGNYTFPLLQRDGAYRVGVTAEGFLPIDGYDNSNPAMQLSTRSQARREIVLERGVSITVTVADTDSEPIRAAGIDAKQNTGDFRYRGPERVYTNEQGEARLILPVSKSPYVIAATAKGFAPTHVLLTPESVDAPQTLNLALEQSLEIDGVAICSDGKPASGWEISAKPEWWCSPYSPRGAKIDEEGRFTLADVGLGRYTLHLSIPMGGGMSSSRQVATVTLPPEKQPLRVDLPMPSPTSRTTVTGRIRFLGDLASSSADHVSVSMTSLAGDREFYHGQVRTRRQGGEEAAQLADDEGLFSFESVPPGAYRLSFESPTIETKVIERVEVPGEVPVVELTVTGRPRLAGTAIDAATGKPIPQFAVRIRKIRTLGAGPNYVPDARWMQVSDPQGRFDIELVGPGVYQVQVSLDGYAWLWSPEISVEKSGSTEDLALKVTPGGAMTGVVVDPAGQPVAGAKVIPLSMARSVAMRSGERFESDAGAVTTDAQGRFALPHLAAGNETLKVTHRDFAPTMVSNLSVVDGQTTDAGPVTLRVGGTVDGVVYDASGNPVPGIALQFQDESGYGGYGDEEAGRLASVSTDEQGRYRVEHLPQQVMYVNVAERWSRAGVVRRVIRPVDGKTARLDFGGEMPVTGRLLVAGQPLPNRLVQLSVQSQHFGPVMVVGSTDADGRFTFHGPPPGRYTLYRQADRGEWVAVRDIEVVAGQALDLGDVASDVGDVLVTIEPEDPADAPKIRYVSVATEQQSGLWYSHVAQAAMEGSGGRQWRATALPSGRYRVQVVSDSEATVNLFIPFTREPGTPQTPVTVLYRKASASLSVTLNGGAKSGDASPPSAYVVLRSDDSTVQAVVRSEHPQPQVLNLPPGTYRVMDQRLAQPREAIPPIVLKAGESRSVEIDTSAPSPGDAMQVVQLAVWSAEGVLVTGPIPRLLDADGKAMESRGDAGLGPLFLVPQGRYRAVLDRPGAEPLVQEVNVATPTTNPDGRPSRSFTVDLVLP